MSIDRYTRVEGGGAVAQFGRLIGADVVQNLAYDGCLATGVPAELDRVQIQPDVVTLTAGGNDLLLQAFDAPDRLSGHIPAVLAMIEDIVRRLQRFHCPIILNTIYDPTDGEDTYLAEMGLPDGVRESLQAFNAGLRELAIRNKTLLADLQGLFLGHGHWAEEPWIVQNIEPNLAGATAIAREWRRLYAPLMAA